MRAALTIDTIVFTNNVAVGGNGGNSTSLATGGGGGGGGTGILGATGTGGGSGSTDANTGQAGNLTAGAVAGDRLAVVRGY